MQVKRSETESVNSVRTGHNFSVFLIKTISEETVTTG